jgi:hypothetical protein
VSGNVELTRNIYILLWWQPHISFIVPISSGLKPSFTSIIQWASWHSNILRLDFSFFISKHKTRNIWIIMLRSCLICHFLTSLKKGDRWCNIQRFGYQWKLNLFLRLVSWLHILRSCNVIINRTLSGSNDILNVLLLICRFFTTRNNSYAILIQIRKVYSLRHSFMKAFLERLLTFTLDIEHSNWSLGQNLLSTVLIETFTQQNVGTWILNIWCRVAVIIYPNVIGFSNGVLLLIKFQFLLCCLIIYILLVLSYFCNFSFQHMFTWGKLII